MIVKNNNKLKNKTKQFLLGKIEVNVIRLEKNSKVTQTVALIKQIIKCCRTKNEELNEKRNYPKWKLQKMAAQRVREGLTMCGTAE